MSFQLTHKPEYHTTPPDTTMSHEVHLLKLRQTIELCQKHITRLHHAEAMLHVEFPLSIETFTKLTPRDIRDLDALVFRFTRLQDTMGHALFTQTLQVLMETTEGVPFIDKLNNLEKLNLLTSAERWTELREIRNSLAHEYPTQIEEFVHGLNSMMNAIPELIAIFEKINQSLTSRFNNV